MKRVFKIITDDGREIFFTPISKESNSYKLTNEYDADSIIIENIHDKNEFDLESLILSPLHKILTDLINASLFLLPNGLDDVDIMINGVFPISMWNITVTLRHEDFYITNSKGYKHLIKGLYTRSKISVTGNKVKLSDFRIFRDTYSKFESVNSYIHSHVTSGSPSLVFKKVCMGESELKTTFMRKISVRNFDIYRMFMYIDAFIKWESLEGGPHFSLDYLYSNIGIENSNTDITIDDIINVIENIDFQVIVYGTYLSIPSNIIEEALLNIGKNKVNENWRKSHPENEWWKEYVYSEPTSMDSLVKFKEEFLTINIIPTTKEYDECARTTYCHISDKLVDKVKEAIESKIVKLDLIPKVQEEEMIEIPF